MRPILSCTVSVLVLCAGLAARAGTPTPSADVAGAAAANEVAGVVVVANRTPEPLASVGQSFTVLTLPQIRADQELVLADVLARTPGVTVTRSGGVGEPTSLSIRGAGTDHTVTLVDGVKLDDPSATGGAFDFANLMVGDVARLEVLRGPQSTLYGSQAIGGVVNIVTAAPTRPFQADAQVEGGSYGTIYGKAAVGGAQGPFTWRVAGNALRTTGISAFDQRLGGRERDGYSDAAVTGRFGVQFTPDVSLDLRGLYVSSRNQFDGFSNPTFSFGDDPEHGKTQIGLGYAGLNFSLFDGRLQNRVAAQYNTTHRLLLDPTDAPVEATFDGHGADLRGEYQGVLAIATGWQAVFGAEAERSEIRVSTPAFSDPRSPAFFPPGSPPIRARVTTDSGYGQLRGEVLPGLTLTGGLRYSAHSTFGGHVTGQASAAWALNGGDTVLRASWGSGFKAPSLYQLYSEFGNLGLKPEDADGWDGGVEQFFWRRRAHVQATFFARDTRNLIDFTTCLSLSQPNCGTGRFGYYNNVARARAWGVELTGGVQLTDALAINVNYTLTDDRNRGAGASFGKRLPRQPRNMVNAELSYVWPFSLTTAVALRTASDSFDDAANATRLRGYALVDLRASYPLTPHLEIYGRVENLTDAAYETTFRYGNLRRAGYVGIRATY